MTTKFSDKTIIYEFSDKSGTVFFNTVSGESLSFSLSLDEILNQHRSGVLMQSLDTNNLSIWTSLLDT